MLDSVQRGRQETLWYGRSESEQQPPLAVKGFGPRGAAAERVRKPGNSMQARGTPTVPRIGRTVPVSPARRRPGGATPRRNASAEAGRVPGGGRDDGRERRRGSSRSAPPAVPSNRAPRRGPEPHALPRRAAPNDAASGRARGWVLATPGGRRGRHTALAHPRPAMPGRVAKRRPPASPVVVPPPGRGESRSHTRQIGRLKRRRPHNDSERGNLRNSPAENKSPGTARLLEFLLLVQS